MEVILLEKVGNLGTIGDKVNVKSGYGRNYLIPQGKAVFATADNVAEFEQRRSELEKAANDKKVAAEARAKSLAQVGSVTIAANAGEEGKLFGSVGPKDIADAFTAAGADLSKSEISMPEGPLRELGEFELETHLHADVVQQIKVIVVAE